MGRKQVSLGQRSACKIEALTDESQVIAYISLNIIINIIFSTSSFYVCLVVDQIDVCDIIYVRFGPYLCK